MKILITGCAGFIGSHLAEKLLENHKVVGIDNLSPGKKENIYHLRSNKDFTFHECEILNQRDFENIFRIHSFDAIFHLAANSDISSGDAQLDFKNTLCTTLVVLEKCKVRGIKQFLFTSSGSVYGEADSRVDESYCGFPISFYAASKISSEAFISAYCSMYDMKSWIFRLPNVIGERPTHGVIKDFISKLKVNPNTLTVLGDGSQTKPYMYVKDCISAMLHVWENISERVNLYNISGLGETSVKEIAEMVIEEMGLDTKIIYGGGNRGWVGDVPQYKCDISRLELLGWTPKIGSNKAVRMVIKKILK